MEHTDLVSEVRTQIYRAAIEAEIRHASSLCKRARGETYNRETTTAKQHVGEARKSLEIAQNYLRNIEDADVNELRQQLAELESQLRELDEPATSDKAAQHHC